MRVLYITTVPAPYKVRFFEELGKSCDLTVIFELDNVSYRKDGWMKTEFENFKYAYLKGIKFKNKIISTEVIKYVKDNKYDLIVIGVYSTISQIIAQLYMKFNNIHYIISSDGGLIKKEKKINYLIKKYFISSANQWLSTGDTTTQYLVNYGAKLENVYKYPFTSIMEDDILSDIIDGKEKKEIRERLNILEDKVIISVGQFIYRKGYDILLKSCEYLDSRIGVYIVGGKPTEEYLKIKKELNLENIHFIDFMDKKELSQYYKASDLFILPTREDIWGLVVNEAIAYGLPIITTNKCVAGLELVSENNGIVIESDSVNQLSMAIIDIFNRDIKTLGRNSIEIARLYTIENMAKEHYEIFKKVIGGSNE